MTHKKTTKKNSLFSVFSDSALCRKDKYLGDSYLNFSDLWDTLTPNARYNLYKSFMTRNYMLFQYGSYKAFANLMGKLQFEGFLNEEYAKKMNSPEMQKEINDKIRAQFSQENSVNTHGIYS